MEELEKAIIKTVCYQSIFHYAPLISSVHKYLFSSEVYLKQEIEECIKNSQFLVVKNNRVYLLGEDNLAGESDRKYVCSKQKIIYARKILKFLWYIPWVKMIGLSGSVASMNADRNEDVDVFIITSAKRMWIVRLCEWIILNISGQRRNAKSTDVRDKICINYYLTEDNLELKNHNEYIAYEAARMIPVYGKDMYINFILHNCWIKEYLANYYNSIPKVFIEKIDSTLFSFLIDWINDLFGFLQKVYMQNKITSEKISNKELKFHPKDQNNYVLETFRNKYLKFIGNS